jgi:hypothetical protein
MVIRDAFPGGKAAGAPPSRVEVKNGGAVPRLHMSTRGAVLNNLSKGTISNSRRLKMCAVAHLEIDFPQSQNVLMAHSMRL